MPVIAERVAIRERGDLRQLADRLRDRQQSGVVVLGAVVDDKPALLAMVSADLVGRGLKAGDVIREIAQHIDGAAVAGLTWPRPAARTRPAWTRRSRRFSGAVASRPERWRLIHGKGY